MTDRVTLQTVADHVGVSRTTVSNAYNRPDQLGDELRERILAAADELGYRGPDAAGRLWNLSHVAGKVCLLNVPPYAARTPGELLLPGDSR